MKGKRTWRWWVTRIELAIGIVAVLLLITALSWPGPFIDPRTPVLVGPLSMPVEVVQRAAALLVAVIGLVWMVRIFRGPRDEPRPWRYRD